MELKTFGYWETKRADQRLALSAIDYMDYQKKVPFEESHLYKKCHNMLFVIYLLQTGQLRIESEIKYLRLYEFEKIVASDMEQIKRDYYIITKKIMEGKASELSEGDTEFLGAARRGDKNSKSKMHQKVIKHYQDDLLLNNHICLIWYGNILYRKKILHKRYI